MSATWRKRCLPPLGLLAELTHRCPLGCPYCSNPLALDRRARRTRHRDLGARVPRSGGARRAAGPSVRRRAGGAARSAEIVAAARDAGLYSNLITSAVGLTRADACASLPTPASTMCRFPSRTASEKSADHIAGYRRRLRRASARSPPKSCGWACRSPSTWWCIAPISTASSAMVDLALALGASRVEIAHVQYYGWALKNRAALMPTREQVEHAVEEVELLRATHHGSIVIDAVVPDYYARFPETLRRRLGPPLAQRHAGGQGAAVPRGRGHPRPRILERARAFACRDLANVAGFQRLPRHRLDAGAVPSLRAARARFRRLPLPGLPDHRRRARADPVCHLSPHHALVEELARCAEDAYSYRHS